MQYKDDILLLSNQHYSCTCCSYISKHCSASLHGTGAVPWTLLPNPFNNKCFVLLYLWSFTVTSVNFFNGFHKPFWVFQQHTTCLICVVMCCNPNLLIANIMYIVNIMFAKNGKMRNEWEHETWRIEEKMKREIEFKNNFYFLNITSCVKDTSSITGYKHNTAHQQVGLMQQNTFRLFLPLHKIWSINKHRWGVEGERQGEQRQRQLDGKGRNIKTEVRQMDICTPHLGLMIELPPFLTEKLAQGKTASCTWWLFF